MLGVIQNLDPPGVGARDLRECLLLQLRDAQAAGLRGPSARAGPFRGTHRPSLERDLEEAGLSPAEVQEAADAVAKLEPKPGLRYSSAGDNYVVPDLVVDKIDGKYHVFVNDDNVPRLQA